MKNIILKGLLLLAFLPFASGLKAQDLNPADWPGLKGYWKFQNPNTLLQATVGNDLQLVGTHQWVPGPVNKDTAIRIGVGSYYICNHNIAPNGGGDSVNHYSLLFDFKILSLKKWHTFFQTDTSNKNDGECFIRPITESNPGRIGTATTGYTPDTVLPGKWYRLLISVKLGHFYRYYLNGQLILEDTSQKIDGRFALNPRVLFFADNNQEDDTIDIASLAIFGSALDSADAAQLGTIDPCLLYPFQVSLGADTLLCGSQSVSKSAGGKNYTYQWSSGEKDSLVVFSAANHGYGNKVVWVKKTDANACVQRDTFLLGIFPAPTVNLGPDIHLCQSQLVKLTAGPASNNTYEWKKLPSGSVVSKVNHYTIDSSGTYMVTMTNLYACSATDTVRSHVHDNRAKPFFSSNQTQFCQGDTAVLQAQDSNKKYLWSTGDTTRTVKIQTNRLMFLKTIDSFACESPYSDSLSLVFHPLPAAPTLFYTPDTVLCSGDSVYLVVLDPFKNIYWNDGYSGSGRYIKQSGSFKVSIEDKNGCFSPSSKAVQIIVHPLPMKPHIEILSGQAHLCPGDSLTLQCRDSAYAYVWSSGGTDRRLVLKHSLQLTLHVLSEAGCRSLLADSFEAVLHPQPPKPIIQMQGKDSLTSLFADSIYQWKIGGVSGFLTRRSIQAEDQKVYVLKTSNGFCWSENSDSFYFEKTAMPHLTLSAKSVLVYPNPTAGLLFIKTNALFGEAVQLRVFNSRGQVCFSLPMQQADLLEPLQLDLRMWPVGIYTLQVETEAGLTYYALFNKI